MADLVFDDRLPRRVPVWLVAGGLTVLVVLGIVAIGMPLDCNLGLSWEGSCATPPAARPAGVNKAMPAPAMPRAVATASGTLQPKGLVAATFSQLGATQPAGSAPGAAAAVKLATRVVKTIAITPGSDPAVTPTSPQPVPLAAAPVAADANSAEAAAPVIAPIEAAPDVAASTSSAPEPLPPPARPAEESASKVAAAAGGNWVVGGSGVTVRSGPERGNAALFNLPAGQSVSVSGDEHGWMHLTDAHGRSGWAYSSYLRKRRG